jgi:hypothetical protein
VNTLADDILAMLKGHTAQKPLRGDFLLAKLNLDPDTCNDLLDDLQNRGALNRAEITRAGETYTALWPTGLAPRALSWKAERDNGKGMFGAQPAHNVQQAAEQSRQPARPAPIVLPHPPMHIPENPMPRIARPAQIVEQAPAEKLRPGKRLNYPKGGPVQSAVLAVLEAAGGWLDVDTIFSRLEISTTKGGVGKTLEMLEKRGQIAASIRFHNKRHRRFYAPLDGADEVAADRVAEAGKPMREERPADHFVNVDKMVDPADVPALNSEGGTHFALFDTGTLLLTSGDDFIALPRAEAQRLADYLRGVSDVLFAEAA